MAKTKLMVTVYLDGESRLVPARTWSEEETLEALGAPMSSRVALEHAKNYPLDFSRGWGFAAEARFVIVDPERVGLDDCDKIEDEPWHQAADWWKTK